MSKIKIKNFGPIKAGYIENDGWIEIKKVTSFIGNQGTGKSTIAKLISTFTWIEKALVRGDYDKKWFEKKNVLKNKYLTYHRLENYLKYSDNPEIEYKGDYYYFKYWDNSLVIEELKDSHYSLPQIMYVPAERNFLAYVKSPKEIKLSSDSLKEFLTEFDNAKATIKGTLKLPINKNVNIEYDKRHDIVNIKGDNYKVKLTDASSGFQSLVPLYLVSWFLSASVKEFTDSSSSMSSQELGRYKRTAEAILTNNALTEEQKRVSLSVLSSRFNKTAFVNIVEEPEQNLFPLSQWQILKSLLEFNNLNMENKLIMTTHSPYVINFLSLVIQAQYLKAQIDKSGKNEELLSKLDAVIPIKSIVRSDDVAIYQLDDEEGTIKQLSTYEGIPSDENYLNQLLKKGNELFDALLEIEEQL